MWTSWNLQFFSSFEVWFWRNVQIIYPNWLIPGIAWLKEFSLGFFPRWNIRTYDVKKMSFKICLLVQSFNIEGWKGKHLCYQTTFKKRWTPHWSVQYTCEAFLQFVYSFSLIIFNLLGPIWLEPFHLVILSLFWSLSLIGIVVQGNSCRKGNMRCAGT